MAAPPTNPEAQRNLAQTVYENQQQDARGSLDYFELPCGYLDPETNTVHKKVILREMTGEEEDLLASGKLPFKQRMDALIGSCITKIGEIDNKRRISALVPDLLLGDRTYLFFSIRRASLGDEFPFRERCPNCEVDSTYPFDLSQLKVTPMVTPEKRIFEAKLPSGKQVRFKCLCGRDEERRDKFSKMLSELSLQIFLRIVDIDGKPPSPTDVKMLSMRDRDHLRFEFATIDGGVETTIEMTCKMCGHDYSREIDPAQPGFFSPSAVQQIWKRRFGS